MWAYLLYVFVFKYDKNLNRCHESHFVLIFIIEKFLCDSEKASEKKMSFNKITKNTRKKCTTQDGRRKVENMDGMGERNCVHLSGCLFLSQRSVGVFVSVATTKLLYLYDLCSQVNCIPMKRKSS